ncbi:MAG: carboxylesterase family protein [Bacteroidota bacterium]
MFACSEAPPVGPDAVVKVAEGQLTGIAGNNAEITVYKGVPFAAPPVDELRWAPPQAPAIWEGVKAADTFGSSCMQNAPVDRLPWTMEYLIANEVDEDCLTLNIWTPAKNNAENLLVFVYFHGGGFVEGSGEVPLYNGENMAAQGIIVVTVNYRLGVFGFLAHPELTAASPNNASGNYALLDKIASLEWIQKNIAAFGGNPDRVTIAGQSAGAISVRALVASPLAKDLFHGAIEQSAGAGLMPTLAEAEQTGQQLLESFDASSISALRALSADSLHTLHAQRAQVRLVPNIDGWIWPTSAYDAGAHNDVPMLMGFTADEFAGIFFNPDELNADAFYEMARENYGETRLDAFKALYPADSEEALKYAFSKQQQDTWAMGLYELAQHRARTGTATTFNYSFDRATPWPEHPRYKAFHSSEIPYVFDNQHLIDRPWEAADRTLASQMSAYWVNFVKTGNPNGEGLPQWPAAADQFLRLDSTIQADEILSKEKIAFYSEE